MLPFPSYRRLIGVGGHLSPFATTELLIFFQESSLISLLSAGRNIVIQFDGLHEILIEPRPALTAFLVELLEYGFNSDQAHRYIADVDLGDGDT